MIQWRNSIFCRVSKVTNSETEVCHLETQLLLKDFQYVRVVLSISLLLMFRKPRVFHTSPLRHPSVNCDLIILYDVIINIYKCTAVMKEIKYTRIELYFKKNTRKNTTKRSKWVRQRAADDPRILTVNVRSRFCCRLPGVAVTGWPRRNAP